MVPIHDVVAGIIAIGLLVGILVLAVSGQDCPEYLRTVFAIAMTWTFRGGVQLSNELRHRNRRQNNG